MQNMPTREKLSDLTRVLTAIHAFCPEGVRRLAFCPKVKSWRGLGGDGKRIAGAFAKVS